MSLTVDIEKRFGSFHLQVKLRSDGGVLSVLGASGCGKSLLLRCIAGIETPDRGRIELNDRVLFDSEKGIDLPPQKRKVGYLFQQYALFPHMTVAQNIRCGLRNKKDTAAAEEMLCKMDLAGSAEKYPRELSGGQQQRTALARILVNGPELLLLDEPFSALDAHLRFRMEEQLRQTIRAFGKPVILVSHDRDEVYRLSDRVAVMYDGHMETVGEKKQVFCDPGTRNAALLTGCKNISPLKKISENRLLATDWGIELQTARPIGTAAYVGVRMHSIIPGGEENKISCRVAEVIENPFSCTVMLDPGKGHIGWETGKNLWQSLQGQTVQVSLPAESLLLLEE